MLSASPVPFSSKSCIIITPANYSGHFLHMSFSSTLHSIWAFLWPFLKAIAPAVLFLLLFAIVRSLWLYWRNRIFESSLTFKLVELKMPREITRSPRSMDQFFHAVG